MHGPATRFTPPPYRRPIWKEDGETYTVCGECNRLLRSEHGPLCGECKAKVARLRKARRKHIKRTKLRERLGVLS